MAVNGSALEQLLHEVGDIKSLKGSFNSKMHDMDAKIDKIQEENKQWKEAVTTLERKMTEVKDSVEMAHNLVHDEAKVRSDAVQKLREDIGQRAIDHANSLDLIKKQAVEVKSAKDTIKVIQNRMDEMEQRQNDANAPVAEMKQQLELMAGPVEYPLNRMIVCQNVWYEVGEDINKIFSTIIHKALNNHTQSLKS